MPARASCCVAFLHIACSTRWSSNPFKASQHTGGDTGTALNQWPRVTHDTIVAPYPISSIEPAAPGTCHKFTSRAISNHRGSRCTAENAHTVSLELSGHGGVCGVRAGAAARKGMST